MPAAKTPGTKKKPTAKPSIGPKATKKAGAAPRRKSPATKPKVSTRKPRVAMKEEGSTRRNLLQAGLSALSLPRAESAMAEGLTKIADSFGLKRLEDVFDQRVASALERIGMPSVEELTRLIDRIEELSALIDARKK